MRSDAGRGDLEVRPMPRATAELQQREEAAPGHYLLQLECAEIAEAAQPGQFVHMRVSEGLEPLLRRPFSIMRAEPQEERLWLLVRVAGRGTELLGAHDEGTRYDLLGPLGRGWRLPEAGENVLLVAGGVGVAPLIFLADVLRTSELHAYVRALFGAATEEGLVCWTELASRCEEFITSTEDGSAGEEGLITQVLARELERGDAERVYACGPRAMLAEVARLCAECKLPGEVSMEQWMGCGVGACLGCVVPAAGGEEEYVRVCTEGPVFATTEIAWDRMQP
jgi:dihydroorotate dehydrogenase electron transfer subunit